MESVQAVAEGFYTAFQAKDGHKMGSYYADEVVFNDPVFPNLLGDQARKMWRMLCKNGKDLEIEFFVQDINEDTATIVWTARYTFSKTGRSVINRVVATMIIQDGKIYRHTDSFSFWNWAAQALGPAGKWLGWTPLIKAKVREQAASSLAAFAD